MSSGCVRIIGGSLRLGNQRLSNQGTGVAKNKFNKRLRVSVLVGVSLKEMEYLKRKPWVCLELREIVFVFHKIAKVDFKYIVLQQTKRKT
jgi:hypothetical protein